MKNFTIKPFEEEYIDELVDVIFDAYQNYPEYGEPTRKDAKKYLKWLKKHSTLFDVVFDGEKPVAFLVVDTDWKDKFDKKSVGEIHELSVRKNYWGKGIGKFLLNRASKHIKEKGLSTARLWVGEKNKEAISFYEKHGFYPILQGWGWLRMERKV